MNERNKVIKTQNETVSFSYDWTEVLIFGEINAKTSEQFLTE